MVPTKYGMPNDGFAARKDAKLSVLQDHFVSSPAYHMVVREILDNMKTLQAAADEAIGMLEDKISRIGAGSRAIQDYCDALFTGVIALEGRMVVYRKSDFGFVTETVLSKRGEEFPFNAIPIYQGFLSYQSLLDDAAKAAIKKTVDDRYNADAPELHAAGAQLKLELAENKIQAWAMSAEAFPEKAEIMDFIKRLMQQFEIFCRENGI